MIENLHQLEPLLKAALGHQIHLVEYTVANRQQDYCVLMARLKHPKMEVLIKLAGPQALMASHFDRTAAIHHLVAQHTTIPMPEMIAVDTSLRDWPWRYMIRTTLPGIEWAAVRHQLTGAALENARWQLGQAVGQLHNLQFPAFGEIDAQGQVAQPDISCLAALKRRAFKLIHSPRLQEAFLAALEQQAAWFQNISYCGLCHEDLHAYNILFNRQGDQWRLAAILDFDKAWAGSPETDLARLEIWRGMTSPAFWDAYRSLRQLEEGYARRRPLYQLLWCLEYADPKPDHLADTRQVCLDLGIPVIDSFD